MRNSPKMWPNTGHSLDGGILCLLHIGRHGPAASGEHRCYRDCMKIAAGADRPGTRKGVLALAVVLLLPFLVYCLTRPARPLPPPVVGLHLMGFRDVGTNLVALLSFTNAGPTEVCLWDSIQLWQLIAETPLGRITNTAHFASVGGEAVPPGSNRVFAVPMPVGSTRWQVRTIYGFQKERHLPSEFYGWVWGAWLVQRTPTPVSDAVGWCLDLLPSGPLPADGEVCTPIITNAAPFL